MRQYPLLHNGIEVGKVSVIQEGLYCRIICECNQAHTRDCCVTAKTGDVCICLGKCSKDVSGYVLRRFIPTKILGGGELAFSISNGGEKNFVELDPDKPFPQIALLPYGRFAPERSGIVIENRGRNLV